MIYLIFEDNTSCMDLTLHLLSAQIKKFSSVCKYYSVCGAPHAADVFDALVAYGEADVYVNRIKQPNIQEHICLTHGDSVIFIVDATAKIAKSMIPSNNHLQEVAIYRTTYYCFESCLFSYQHFGTNIRGKSSDFVKFESIRNMICSTSFPTLQSAREYNARFCPNSKQLTVEDIATSVFASYMQYMRCVKINKRKYHSLSEYYESDELRFFNNNCNFSCDYCCQRRLSNSNQNSCSMPELSNNLFDFYYNSLWSAPLECLYNGTDLSLLEIFKEHMQNNSFTEYFT